MDRVEAAKKKQRKKKQLLLAEEARLAAEARIRIAKATEEAATRNALKINDNEGDGESSENSDYDIYGRKIEDNTANDALNSNEPRQSHSAGGGIAGSRKRQKAQTAVEFLEESSNAWESNEPVAAPRRQSSQRNKQNFSSRKNRKHHNNRRPPRMRDRSRKHKRRTSSQVKSNKAYGAAPAHDAMVKKMLSLKLNAPRRKPLKKKSRRKKKTKTMKGGALDSKKQTVVLGPSSLHNKDKYDKNGQEAEIFQKSGIRPRDKTIDNDTHIISGIAGLSAQPLKKDWVRVSVADNTLENEIHRSVADNTPESEFNNILQMNLLQMAGLGSQTNLEEVELKRHDSDSTNFLLNDPKFKRLSEKRAISSRAQTAMTTNSGVLRVLYADAEANISDDGNLSESCDSINQQISRRAAAASAKRKQAKHQKSKVKPSNKMSPVAYDLRMTRGNGVPTVPHVLDTSEALKAVALARENGVQGLGNISPVRATAASNSAWRRKQQRENSPRAKSISPRVRSSSLRHQVNLEHTPNIILKSSGKASARPREDLSQNEYDVVDFKERPPHEIGSDGFAAQLRKVANNSHKYAEHHSIDNSIDNDTLNDSFEHSNDMLMDLAFTASDGRAITRHAQGNQKNDPIQQDEQTDDQNEQNNQSNDQSNDQTDEQSSGRLLDLMFASNADREMTRYSSISALSYQSNEDNTLNWRGVAETKAKEKRVDPEDGQYYTRDEFLQEYGTQEGSKRWENSRHTELRIDPNDGRPYDKSSFIKEYGNEEEWNRAQPLHVV